MLCRKNVTEMLMRSKCWGNTFTAHLKGFESAHLLRKLDSNRGWGVGDVFRLPFLCLFIFFILNNKNKYK